MWCHAALATAVMTLAVTPACAAKITVSQYGRLVALTLLLFAFAAIGNALLLVVERRVHRR